MMMDNEGDKNSTISVKSKIKSYLTEAALSTTTHGIDKIVMTKRNFLKLAWILLFLGSIAACSYFIANTVIEYLDYEVVTKIQVIYEVPQLFPTVSICNLNIFNNKQSIEFAKKILSENNITDPFNHSFVGFHMTPPLVGILVKNLVAANFRNPNLTQDAIQHLGINYDEFIISCTFNIEPCNSSLFEWYFDITYGSCFKFNPNNGSHSGLHSYRAGSLNGFRIELFIADLSDPYSFSSDSGAYVSVQNATDTSPNHVGVKAQVGTDTDIQVIS
jgi:hypothetical protein